MRRSYLGLTRLCAISLALVFAFSQGVFGQEETAETEAPLRESSEDAMAADLISDEERRLDLDIRTATFQELLAWCRDLGLDESGTKENLSTRLRAHFGLSAQAAVKKTENEGLSIVVESAHSTEYFSLEAVGEDYARLSGAVVVSLKDGETTHRIKADEIIYNRTKNSVSAYGDVEYSQSGSASAEIFRGQSLNIDLNDFTGVFLSGASEKSQKGESVAYIFKGDIIAKTGDDVTILGDAEIRTAAEKDVYWSLEASRIWLLPSSEWAVSNAVLKVGEIPLLYIPFFYLPGDELIFHPVLGYRPRVGSYVQTTSYILGKPKPATKSESSIMKILQTEESPNTVQDGLFLRKSGSKASPDDGKRLALLIDIYANLGAYLGFTLDWPGEGQIGDLSLSAGIAFSRTVNKLGVNYTPYAADGSSDWNYSTVFSLRYPFRFRLKAEGSLKTEVFPFSWSFPLYSDPFVDQDFLNRSENMDWFNIIKQGAAAESADSSAGVISTFQWKISTSYRPDIKDLAPYISAFSVSSASSSLSFSKGDDKSVSQYSPNRSFFYPDKFNIISVTSAISGKPYSWSSVLKKDTVADGASKKDEAADDFFGFGVPRSPWGESFDEKKPENDVTQGQKGAPGTAAILKPPDLSQRFDLSRVSPTASMDLSYSLSPSLTLDAFFPNGQDGVNSIDAVSWDSFTSVLTTAKASSEIAGHYASSNGLADITLALKANASLQTHPYLNDSVAAYDTPSEREAAIKRDYSLTFFKSSLSAGFNSKPFSGDMTWGSSSVSYVIGGELTEVAFVGSASVPKWEITGPSWDKESISSHSLSFNFSALIYDQTQSLNLKAELPPRDTSFSLSSTINAGISTTSVSIGAVSKGSIFKLNPISLNEKIIFDSKKSLTQKVVYNPDINEFTNFETSLSLDTFNAQFNATKTRSYYWDQNLGWRLSLDSEALHPKNLILSYKFSDAIEPFWLNRVSASLDLSSSLSLDLLRVTQSTMSFTFGSTFKIHKFLDLSFSSVSQNSVLYRYIQDLPFLDFGIQSLPGEKNIFIDLLKSFNFFREADRRASGFKLRSLAFTATHYLGDWNAKLSLSVTPYLDNVNRIYRFNNALSFLIQWLPFSEFKTEIKDDKDGFAFK